MDGELPNPASIREGLLAEHARLEALLRAVIGATEAGDGAIAANALAAFSVALNAQLDAEDALLVAALPNERNARILSYEHRYVRGRLKELAAAAEAGALEARPLYDLRDILRAHARNDDRLLYAWADAELDDAQRAVVLERLGRRLEACVSSETRYTLAG